MGDLEFARSLPVPGWKPLAGYILKFNCLGASGLSISGPGGSSALVGISAERCSARPHVHQYCIHGSNSVAVIFVHRCAARLGSGIVSWDRFAEHTFLFFPGNERLRRRASGFFLLGDTGTPCHTGAPSRAETLSKNEGLVFLVSIVAAQGLIGVAQQKSLRGLKPLEPFCVGLAFPLCVFFYFKFRIAPASYFVQPFSDILAKITDLSRYRQVAAAIAIKAWHFGDWVLSAFATLSIYLLLAGVKKRNEDLPQIEIGLLTLFFTLCSYFAAYIVTPFSLAWHLESSLDRLLLQLWPSFLFMYFIAQITGFRPV